MAPQQDEDDQMLWLDEEAVSQQQAEATESDGDRAAQLELELQRTKQELSDVRKDLAAKARQGEPEGYPTCREDPRA